ncbi:MAG: Smr/MutS family protein [Myxococcales bacterium]|nr:Smr/MutS family protein [Myxococcales bacterium]
MAGQRPFNNPFTGLKLKAVAETTPKPARLAKAAAEPDDEGELFRLAVGEVTPLRNPKGLAPPKAPPTAASLRIVDEEIEALTRLCELVAGEGPFDLSDSDEFIEGHVQGLDVRILHKLSAGEYSPRAHLDLHGLSRAEAKVALERFVQKARLDGHRSVLVVTGRGLHSKDQLPVLKAGVQGWLSRGRLARQVLAFSTARPQDGGAGALYVLLRR